jgi:hypothetical protein
MERSTGVVESLSIQNMVVKHALINGTRLPIVSQLIALLIASLRNGLIGANALKIVALASKDVLVALMCKPSMEVKFARALAKSRSPVSSCPAQWIVKSAHGQTRESVTCLVVVASRSKLVRSISKLSMVVRSALVSRSMSIATHRHVQLIVH